MTHWQTVLVFWLALQLPIAVLLGKALKQLSFDVEASSVETVVITASSPDFGVITTDNSARLT